jgi:hypothetical protein
MNEVVMKAPAGIRMEEWRPDGLGAASVDRDLDMLADVL